MPAQFNCKILACWNVVDLGAMFDNNQKMDIHISSVCRATHFHLRNIGAIRSHLTDSATASLVHSLVTSRLDYCNSLLYGLPDNQLNRLQRLQNIAARIVTRSPKHDHITPVLKELQGLPVRMRVLFSSPSGWRDIGVLFVENRHLEMLLL